MGKSFLGKIGNVLEDAGSAALPAGLAFLASGGNPFAAGAAGLQGFQANEAGERARKFKLNQNKARDADRAANEQSQGQANLINALSPRAGARATQTQTQVTPPTPGVFEKLAGLGAQGFQLGDAAFNTDLQRAKDRGTLQGQDPKSTGKSPVDQTTQEAILQAFMMTKDFGVK